MKYLTDKELKFWNGLINDYDINQDKSFINTLFLGLLQSNEDLKNSLFDMYSNPSFINLFNKSDLLLETQNGVYVCKYKEFCKSFYFEYNEDLSLIEKQSKDFDNLKYTTNKED